MAARIWNAIFFGNYFLGSVVAALAYETVQQLGLPPLPLSFYLLLFLGTVVYYTYAYKPLTHTHLQGNARATWYWQHRVMVWWSQRIGFAGILVLAGYLLFQTEDGGFHLPIGYWLLAFFTAALAFAYYGVGARQLGLLKPLLIGWVWAMMVTLGPVAMSLLLHPGGALYHLPVAWLALKNFMFVAATAALFDIKDYASDANHRLQTLVVRIGLRKTLFRVVMPLGVLGSASALLFGWQYGLPPVWIVLNQLPFLALLVLSYALRLRRSIFFYLTLIDGLLLFKALCGIAGAWLSA